jgi:hypothetical protein
MGFGAGELDSEQAGGIALKKTLISVKPKLECRGCSGHNDPLMRRASVQPN